MPAMAEAREQEDLWFAKTLTWRELPRRFQNNLGTKKLVQRLESILSDLMTNWYATAIIFVRTHVIDILQVFPNLGLKSEI